MLCNGDQNKAANREPPQGRTWKSAPSTPLKTAEKQQTQPRAESLCSLPKVPSGNSPYVKAKHVQLVDKDPNKAISLFWAAINSGDRVNSALKDMAIVMKQVGRADEAVEAIKSFRYLCSADAQESLDNVLLDLYKRCGRMDEQIELLEHKLKLIEEGLVFGGKRTKIARSQGKKFHLSIDQERSRLLGNLAWAHLQQGKFQTAEALYRKALSIAPDKNKQCNLAICLLQTGRISEAKSLLARIQPSTSDLDQHGPDSYMKSFERAAEMLAGLESQLMKEAVEKQAQEEQLLEKDIERSSLSSTPNKSLNIKGTINRNQNHGAAIGKELTKTEIQSYSSSVIDGILNCPDSGSGTQNKGQSQWRDGNNAVELGSQDFVCENLTLVNDGDEGTSYSTPFTMGNLTPQVSNDQNCNQGSQILASGQSRWRNDSAEELLVSDEKSNYYNMPNAFSTLNSASLNVGAVSWAGDNGAEIDAEAYSWVWNDEIEEEAFADENLNSNLPASFPSVKWAADSTPVPVRGNARSPIKVPTTMTSRSATQGNGNWKGRANAFHVPIQRSSKHPSQVLSSRQSPIHADWRWRVDILPVSVQGDQGAGMSPGLIQGNSERPTQVPRIAQMQSPSNEDWKRRFDDIPSNGIEKRWADSTAEKLPCADRNTNPQPEPNLIGNPRAETAFQRPSASLLASPSHEDSNCSSVISASSKQIDCTDEKWSVKFGNLDSAIPIGSPAIENQKTVGIKHQADGSPGSHKEWADAVDENTENTKAAYNFSAFGCGKTWAEMVEEEEEALVISNLNLNVDVKQPDPISKQSASWNDKDTFPDENLNFNIIQSSPCRAVWSPSMLRTPQKHQRLLRGYTDSSQWMLETVDVKEEGFKTHPYSTPNTYSNASSKQRKNMFSTGREQNSSARRCLSFEPLQKQGSASDYSPAPTKIFDVDDYSYLQAIGSGSKRRGNRLRVFQEMTPSDSPRA